MPVHLLLVLLARDASLRHTFAYHKAIVDGHAARNILSNVQHERCPFPDTKACQDVTVNGIEGRRAPSFKGKFCPSLAVLLVLPARFREQ